MRESFWLECIYFHGYSARWPFRYLQMDTWAALQRSFSQPCASNRSSSPAFIPGL